MGYIRDEAIIVTADKTACLLAQKEAIVCGLRVTSVEAHNVNGLASFLIVPDGSKEGWQDSDDGEHARKMRKAWARSAYGRLTYVVNDTTKTFFAHWVHVAYDEEGDCSVKDSWKHEAHPESWLDCPECRALSKMGAEPPRCDVFLQSFTPGEVAAEPERPPRDTPKR